MTEKAESKKLHQAELSTDDLVRLWRPRALTIALISPTPDPVAEYLEKMRVPRHEAAVAAILIWNEAQKSRVKSMVPRVAVCLYFMGIGMALVLVGLFSMLLLVAVGAITVVISGAVLAGEFLDRR